MKNRIKIIAICIVVAGFASFACSTNEPAKNTQSTEKQTYRSKGVVKKVDGDAGKITVDHEDIPGYMSAMEMTESVADKAILATIKAGDKVDFEFDRVGSKITITKLTKTGEAAIVDAAELFKTSCSECHGANGEGAKKGIPLKSGHALSHGEDEMLARVKNGKEGKMPAFATKLSEDQIKEVVKFVRTEIQKGAKPEAEHDHHHH